MTFHDEMILLYGWIIGCPTGAFIYALVKHRGKL